MYFTHSAVLLRTVPNQRAQQRCGNSYKNGCPFYVAFTVLHDNQFKYRCSGIHAEHTCDRDPATWDRIARYRNQQDPHIHSDAVLLMENGLRSGQAASFLNAKHGTRLHPKDMHRIVQTNKEKTRALSDTGLSTSEIQRLMDEITRQGDQYRVKYKDNTQVMDCLLYWDPTDVQLARRFCQVNFYLHWALIEGFASGFNV